MQQKTFMFMHRKAPFGSGYASEMLDAALIAASFDQEVHLAFLDDGVFQLLKDQHPEQTGHRDLTKTFLELADYDIEQVWVERESLAERGLSESDLVIPVTLLDRNALTALIADMDMVLGA